MVNILFVCVGNTCRSVMCEYIFKNMLSKKNLINKFNVTSCGISASNNAPANQNAIKSIISLTNNSDIKNHVSKIISSKLIEDSNYIFALDHFVFNYISENFNNILNNQKTKNLYLFNSSGIPDPYGSSFENYLNIAQEIHRTLEEILKQISKNIFK